MNTCPRSIHLLLACVVIASCHGRYPKDNSDVTDMLGPTSNWIDSRPHQTSDGRFSVFDGLNERSGMSLFRMSMPLLANLGTLTIIDGNGIDEKRQALSRILDLFDGIYSDPMYTRMGFDSLEPVYQLSMPMYLGQSTSYRIPYGHYYAFVPPDLDRSRPVEVVLFLHGRGPNMTAWLFRVVTGTDRSLVVVSPTASGSGNWAEPDNMRLALSAVDQVSKRLRLDQYRLHAVGHSNGGVGVMELAMRQPQRFASVTAVASGWSNFGIIPRSCAGMGTTFHFICGDRDRLMPLSVQAVQHLDDGCFDATLTIEKGRDHHIMIDSGSLAVQSALQNLVPK